MSARKRKSTRRGKLTSREAMHAKRAKPPAIDPCPPGPAGGQYKPLSEADCQAIFDTALLILDELGMGEAPEVLVKQAVSSGARVNASGRLCFPPEMVQDAVASACKTFTFYGRDPKHDFEVGGDKVYFGTGGAAVQTLDLDSSEYRPSTLQDLYDFARLTDTLSNVSWFTRCCVATDLPDNFELDTNTAYALLKGTTKPVGTSFFIDEYVDPIVDMFDTALGGKGRFAQRPFCKAHISPVISPLRYGEDAVLVALACMRRGMPLNNIIAAQSGATSPATLAGMLAATLAETLAALLMVDVFERGYPMIFSNWPFTIDLRTGSFAGSGGEISLLNAAAAQLSNWLGLPSGVAASMSDAKAVDAQMGLEKALSSLATGLAGSNMIYESSGMMASLLGASFEAFLIDDEMLSHVYRILRGIEVNEDTLGFNAIADTVKGEGHFLGHTHTMEAMQRDHYYPKLSDRIDPRSWQQEGKTDMWQRAKVQAKDILRQHHPQYIDPTIDKQIRQRYKIML